MNAPNLYQPKITSEALNKLSVFTWVKDKKFRFVSCSENLCELAGEESPHGMIGKDDFALVWRKDADHFRDKDIQIISGEIKYINVYEVIDVISSDGAINKQPILITKTPLYDKNGNCIGIAGSHVNLPPKQAEENVGRDEKGRLWLPKALGKLYLTKKESEVLKYILYGKTSKQIAQLMNISPRTIEEYTDRVKSKLQCSHKQEIHSVAIEYGITHLL